VADDRAVAGPFIAGFDGSATAAAAVRLAARLAAGAGAQVVAAHVFAAGHDGAGARAASEALLAQVREPGMRQRSIAAHSAAEGLRDVARHEGAALLAVGRTHDGPVGRGLADSVPDQLLGHAPCAVLVAMPGISHAIGVIGVAFDGGDQSRAALDAARDIALTMGARIVLLGVAESSWRADVDDAGYGPAEWRVLRGPVAPALAHACGDGIDLLVAGSRGYGPMGTVIAGSVSRHLAHHAPCSVIVVPRGSAGLRAAGRPTVSAA